MCKGLILKFNKNPLFFNYKSEKLNINWGRKEAKFFSKIHGISSYLAMFGPSLPSFFINKYTDKNDLIMDNFSGRGTTALVSKELDRNFIGTDLNPYSYVLTNFKISKLKKESLLKKLEEMEEEYNNSEYPYQEINEIYKEMEIIYSKATLKQLIFLREKYGVFWRKANKEINAILAFALGLMHGKSRKNGETIYFSLDMPNVISMSPNYIKSFSKKNKLKKPKINIFQKIKDRILEKFDNILEKETKSFFLLADATIENKKIENNSIDLVITSPPYLNIVNYTKSHWIKLWLLGYDRKTTINNIKLTDKLKYNEYVIFIQKYLNAIHPKLKNKAKVCLVVGDVLDVQLIERVWEEIKSSVKYEFDSIYYDMNYKQSNKITNMLNKKSGKATTIEKVLVLEKR